MEKDQNAVSKGDASKGFDVTDEDGNRIDSAGEIEGDPDTTPPIFTEGLAVKADLELDLKQLMELLKEARESDDGETTLDIPDDAVTLTDNDGTALSNPILVEDVGAVIFLGVADIEAMIDSLDKKAPPLEQIRFNNGAGNIISKLVFNTVTTLFVGEKIMIEMPTWFFPGGAGPYSFTANMISHGEPTPAATFRFAEPIFIDKQQNFRVEIDIPDSDVHKEIQKIYGPLFVWVVLDGYMTRDVQ